MNIYFSKRDTYTLLYMLNKDSTDQFNIVLDTVFFETIFIIRMKS